MAKCSICGKRKGKRQCFSESGMICSQCCGETRKIERCGECRYYRSEKDFRRYTNVPRFSAEEMDFSDELKRHSYVIEKAVRLWDLDHEERLNDEAALEVYKMLLDKRYFGDATVSSPNELFLEGFERLEAAIENNLSSVPADTIVKTIGVLYFVAQRRSTGGREYFEVLQDYVL